MRKRTSAENKIIEVREFHTPTSGLFFRAKQRLFSGKSAFQRMEVIATESFGRILLLDGLVQTTEKDEFFYHEMLVHPAMACHPDPKEVLIIGGGDGGALREVLRYPVSRATVVEIDAGVIAVCKKYFPQLSSSFRDKRAEVIIGDGNRFVKDASGAYDVILVDSSDPVGPSAVLHQRGFYSRLGRRLRPGGVVAGQAGSPLYHLKSLKAKRVFLRDIFRNSCFYLGPVPTYPGGIWCYVFLSDKVDPCKGPRKELPPGLRYYSPGIHRAAFVLPEFLNRDLS